MNNIALIGYGYWGKKVLPYLIESYDHAYVYTSKDDLRKMLEEKSINNVFIATPIGTHEELAVQCMAHGKNVFSEKPLALSGKRAEALKLASEEAGVKLAVDYTNTFSHGIRHMVKACSDIGFINYIEMNVKHLGRFMYSSVYWLLASHCLSVLDMILDISRCTYGFEDLIFHCDSPVCTAGRIRLEHNGTVIDINVSLNYPGKDCTVNIYGTEGTLKFNPQDDVNTLEICKYSQDFKKEPAYLIKSNEHHGYDESNNLRYAVEYFQQLCTGDAESNIDTAIKIARILHVDNE